MEEKMNVQEEIKKSTDFVFFREVQDILEEGMPVDFAEAIAQRKIIVNDHCKGIIDRIVKLGTYQEELFESEYDELETLLRAHIMEWYSLFFLPADFVQGVLDSKFAKIVSLFALKINKADDSAVAESNNYKFEKPVISLKNIDIKYNFGKPTEYYAIKSASVDIYAGELVIFFGPSGCGKSTLVNTIAGLERPVSGSVEVMSNDILQYDYDQMADYHANTIGFVFQAYNLIESLSVEDNIIFPQMFSDVSRADRKKKALDLLRRFEIEKHAKKSPVMLSGGQQQRVGIARALINNPEIILADEPIGNLDTLSAEIVINIFRDLSKKENKTVVLVTHNAELLSIANRVIYMKDGVIVKEEVNNDVRPERIKKKKKEEMEKDDSAIPKELKNLLKVYGSISASQLNTMWIPLKAKMITDQILQKYTREQLDFIEEIIKRRLMGIISRVEVFNLLDLPLEEGGAGLDKRTASLLTDRVETILTEIEKIKKFVSSASGDNSNNASAEEEAVVEIRKQLLAPYDGHLVQQNIDNLEKYIRLRLENKIDKGQVFESLNASLIYNGAGFGKSTAKKFARELELLMLIKFGEEAETVPNKKI